MPTWPSLPGGTATWSTHLECIMTWVLPQGFSRPESSQDLIDEGFLRLFDSVGIVFPTTAFLYVSKETNSHILSSQLLLK